MKTIASLLSMIVISFTVMAQSPGTGFRNIEPNPVNELKQRLDSIVVMACPALESNGLENWEKYNYYYDYAGRHSVSLYSAWNANLGSWESKTKTEFFLNPDGSIAKTIMYVWDPMSAEWRDALKKEFVYDINQNMLSETEYAGGDPAVPWMPHYKAEYTYNSDHKVLSKVISNYYVDEAAWVFVCKSDYFYHANGYLVSQTESVWKKFSSSWESTYRYEYAYGQGWKLVVKSEFSWNPDIALWENRYKTSFTYNYMDKPGTITRFWWNYESSEWQCTYKNEYVYDLGGNQIRETGSYWDHFVLAWRYDSKKECEYNLAVTADELVSPHDMGIYGYTSRNMMTSLTHFKQIAGNWTADYQYAYYYHPFGTTGIEEPGISTIRVFPNPAGSTIAFSWNEFSYKKFIEVYDLGGKLILRQSIYQNVNIDISALPEGGYIYRLFDEKLLPLSGKFNVVR